ncbi:MAG: M90 family metallopeptidase [Burkholderiales bacterium]
MASTASIERAAIGDAVWRRTVARFAFVRQLADTDLARLRDLAALFLDAKTFSGAEGLELTDEMMLAIAVQACVLILNLDPRSYDGWSDIIVYPVEFLPEHTWVDESGVVHHDATPKMGEAWLRGPVVLSWADVARGGSDDGVNVVIHEFAHKLDMLNGDVNGFPPLHKGMSRETWSQVFSWAYQDFCRRVRRRESTAIDPYAAESPGEFFAVLSEVFFESPAILVAQYPAVHDQLVRFYRQDPHARQSIVREIVALV